jgi:hypothetical protein
MPAALPTRAQLEHQLRLARAAVILAEDRSDIVTAQAARDECDRLLEQLHPEHVDS